MDIRPSNLFSTEEPSDTNTEVEAALKTAKNVRRWIKPDSDDENDENRFFDVKDAWDTLLKLPSRVTIMLSLIEQKKLKLVVGTNVSQEFPWKQIRLKHLYNSDIFDYVENADILLDGFRQIKPENHILIGYCPILTQDLEDIPAADPFITFLNPDDAKMALFIIRNIEMYENWCMNQRLLRKPRVWFSLGSENEIADMQRHKILDPVDVEIQSVYPLQIPAKKEFNLRKAKDVRDGYVELLPSDSMKFENITRKRITVGIQSSPTLVSVDQQTDPTFPTNAWSQYVYEIDEADDELDITSEEEDDKKEASAITRPLTADSRTSAEDKEMAAPPELSDQIKLLLRTLEFNQVDMYRNDYPRISDRECQHYTVPVLEESLCFANISKSFDRFVCAVDWYLSISGLLVASYTFSTPSTIYFARQRRNIVQRDVLQPNPVLMWSFSDNLNAKLEFSAPREVTALSFCPFNTNLLIGGMGDGQVIIWDLQDRAEKLDVEEILTAAQQRYRLLINDFFEWTIQINDNCMVAPTIITNLEVSHKSAITGIYWLSNNYFVSEFGKVSQKIKAEDSKFFMTCSADGSIFFWDLGSLKESKVAAASRRDLPQALLQSESAFKNKILTPTFKMQYNEPLSSILADTSIFHSVAMQVAKRRRNKLNYAIQNVRDDPPVMRQSLITSSFYGHIDRVDWHGLYGGEAMLEAVTIVQRFARVHDGPITSIKRNPFMRNLFVSIGRSVFAVWNEDFTYAPILWRQCQSDLTAVAWSENRPAVIFLTRIDGCLEAWDLISRDYSACLVDTIGGGVVTAISEHKLTEPEKLLGIGDYNSSFRMVRLPEAFYVLTSAEKRVFSMYLTKEESRKKFIYEWEEKYNEINKDVIDAKRQAEQEARREMERWEKEQAMQEARRAIELAEQAENQQPHRALSYPERMARQWEELNFKRMMDILMSRKRVDAEQLAQDSRLEKEHLAYEAAKKESVQAVLKNVANEVATIRSRILPAEKIDLRRTDMVMVAVRELLEFSDSYAVIEEEYDSTIGKYDQFDDIDYLEYLKRGEHRRKLLNKSLGGNTERLYWYDKAKELGTLDESDFGLEYFLKSDVPPAEEEGRQEVQSKDDEENLEDDDI